ncbi:uncharacterized protein MONOS_15005 [Monocercomonoides exilis]|uniref:uncharacterized protein n=1 Tax=Monocercomonoides exilis TaxID=2049356 RepID=UPI00355940C8|nr:hypothetical protein MONOS_15005 [Monocercomonoides exilis]|eukprot:MONOS_15005.1-p1 / transcript=MONOS_15005.1 / gene=MONOS_15005 / organism=Monocercomonoides_exilis_PA203 / gene_product=unspecified product / transcript_product=unspecified product / location=Mono_scaffold01125:5151-5522(+) / protein_length=124 / sequence_SO=supercontig / SO=protein_coding / is_pseudo=false
MILRIAENNHNRARRKLKERERERERLMKHTLMFKQVAKQLQGLENSKMNAQAHCEKLLMIRTCKTMPLQLCGQLFPEIHRSEKRDEMLFMRTYEIEEEVLPMAPFGSTRLQTAERETRMGVI